jgi:Putative zinc-finger
MINFWGGRNPERRHPSDESIVAYLDGEIAARKHRQIESHLAGCWKCRRRREKLERAIGEFVDYMDTTCPPPPRAWRNFERGLAERERAEAPRASPRPWFRVPARALQYAAAALVLGLVMWSWLTPRTVSAKEFLDRGIRAESASLERAGKAMVYQKLRVQRSSTRSAVRAGTVELWRDATAPHFRRAADDEIWRDLDRVLSANGMDPQRPLSPAGYGSWRDRIGGRDEEVSSATLSDGSAALALVTTVHGPHAEDAIIQARLLVRADNWHPVTESLKVQGSEELLQYELTEVAFDVRPLDPKVFADAKPLAAAVPLQAKPPESPTAVLVDYDAVEVQAWYALHRLRACLGEPVQVVREPSGRVLVQGLAETPARKQELLAALNRITGLRLDIRTPDEYPTPAARPQSTREATGEEPQKSVLPIQPALTEYFRTHADHADISGRIAALSTDAVTLSGAFLADAWSLRRLADAYTPERIAALDAAHQRLLEDMFRDHAAALREEAGRSSALLEPVLGGIAGQEPVQPAGLTTPVNPCTILEAAQTAERLTRGLLAGSDDMPETPEQGAGRLLTSLREVHAGSTTFEAALRGGLTARECRCQTLSKR